jgi:hypothetical protein
MTSTIRTVVAGKFLALGVSLVMSASAYGAESTHESYDERLNRIFVGVPNQLTLPPGFPVPVDTASNAGRDQTTDGDVPVEDPSPGEIVARVDSTSDRSQPPITRPAMQERFENQTGLASALKR